MDSNLSHPAILSFFASLNIDKLRFYLKEEYSYQNTTKEIFLIKIEKIFDDFKNSGDTELIRILGACASKSCPNCGMKGSRFVGNHSGNYLDLIFDETADNIKDIFYCSEFEPFTKTEGSGKKYSIYFDMDNDVKFHKSLEYWVKVNAANVAYSEIITTPPQLLDYEELCYWLEKYAELYKSIGEYNMFSLTYKWTPFCKLYSELMEFKSYISDHIQEITAANNFINHNETEQNLIDWILKHEAIYEEASMDLMYSLKKEGENYILDEQKLILFTGDLFCQILTFIEYYQGHNDKLLLKYNTYTREEEADEYNKLNSDSADVDVFSLRFHLARRNELAEIGITIPLYMKKDEANL